MIRLHNVRVNNLKNVDLEIPQGQWLTLCGVSGSGKSSLAFDTLYAEGQRRYIESLSPHTRQFIHQLEKPDADLIEGVPPAIAIRAVRGKFGRKSTVGTATDISSYLRVLFTAIGNVVCPTCDVEVTRNDPQSVAQSLSELAAGARFQIVFMSEQESVEQAIIGAKKSGFARAIVDAKTIDLTEVDAQFISQASHSNTVEVIVDRLKTGSAELTRIQESLEIAFQYGAGQCCVLVAISEGDDLDEGVSIREIGGSLWKVLRFSRKLACSSCAREFPDAEPRLFSFSNKLGACATCEGIGFSDKFDRQPCLECKGMRLNENALSFRIAGQTIGRLGSMKINETFQFFESLELSDTERELARMALTQIAGRLSYLCQVGLPYLNLDRPLRSLSAGEAQRVSLTSCLSSTLVNMLYVLDEPSVGLHAHDVGNLAAAIERLHARGNTIAVVDHDDKMISSAERIVEIGPSAGVEGGEVVFDGTLDELVEDESSLTGDFVSGRRGSTVVAENRRKPRGKVRLTGASGHNLKNIDVEFPLGCLCVVTGVSGAGKSSLVQQTLYGAICKRKERSCDPPLPYDDIFGDGLFDEVVLVDQSPIGRSARSNPVTYVKAFDDIRRTYADSMDAKTHNIKMGQFSFNVAGGRCDKCDGEGQLTIDMQFMSDVYIKCSQCRGTRYRDEILAVKYRGKSISETLELTVREAFSFFRGQPKVQAKLKSLIDVGLDYIRLGQPATTLSSGEAQRLKLGHYLNAAKSKRALFIMDEPTTGLHMSDVVKLNDCFDALLSVGHSLIIVEHNLQLIKYADWIIDLGPGAADEGGTIVATGTPEDVSKSEESITGQYLKDELKKS